MEILAVTLWFSVLWFVITLARLKGGISELGNYLRQHKVYACFPLFPFIFLTCDRCLYIADYNELYHASIPLGSYEIRYAKGRARIEMEDNKWCRFYTANQTGATLRDFVMDDGFKIYKNADSDTIYLCKDDMEYISIISEPTLWGWTMRSAMDK